MGYLSNSQWRTRADVIKMLQADDKTGAFYKVLKSRSVGSCLFSVVEYINESGDIVRTVRIDLIKKIGADYGYKTMDESVGPYYYNCPLNFLDNLTAPIGYASEWREKVRAYHAERKSRPLYRPGLKLSFNGWIYELIAPAGPRRGWHVRRNDGADFRAGFPVLSKMLPIVTDQDKLNAYCNGLMSKGRDYD